MNLNEKIDFEYHKAIDTRKIQSKENIVMNATQFVQLDNLKTILKKLQFNKEEEEKLLAENDILEKILFECNIAEVRADDQEGMVRVVMRYAREH